MKDPAGVKITRGGTTYSVGRFVAPGKWSLWFLKGLKIGLWHKYFKKRTFRYWCTLFTVNYFYQCYLTFDQSLELNNISKYDY